MMKTVQKLEIFAGILTFLLTLPNVYLNYVSFSKWIEESRISTQEVLVPNLIFLVSPAFLVAFGTYLHIVKRSMIGFGMIFICGGILTITHLLGSLAGNAFNDYPLLGISPGLFAFITIILAFFNVILVRK